MEWGRLSEIVEGKNMANINTDEAMRELTMMLIYLSRFAQGEKFDN